MEKSCLKKTLTPQIPVTTHANLVQLLTSLSLRAIQKLLHKGKRSQSTNAREKCKKMYLKQEKSNETHLSASMYIFLKTIIFMILGAFATTFPNEMKPSNHTFSPPPPKKQQKQQQRGKESEKSRDERKSEKQNIKVAGWGFSGSIPPKFIHKLPGY